jgi:hypothetical protein
VFGIILPFKILPIPLGRDISLAHIALNASKYYLRPLGIFVEPGYAAQFLLPGLALSLFGWMKKEKADIIIYQDDRDKEGLGVSLKYGKGQFNSLSPNTVLKSLYGLDDLQVPTDENKRVPGILSQITKDNKDAEESINMGAKAYIDFILDNYKDIKYKDEKSKIKGDTKNYLTDPRDFKSTIDKIDQSGDIPVKKVGDIPIKDMTWQYWRDTEKSVQKAFAHSQSIYIINSSLQ